MNLYSILVFLHVVGAVGIFAALGIETVAMGQFRRAETPAAARAAMALFRAPRFMAPVSMLATLVTGVWLMAKWFGPRPWTVAALAGVVIMAVAGGVITGRRMKRLGMSFPVETGPRLSETFRSIQTGAALGVSLRLRMAVGITMLALMTLKPAVAGSVLALTAAVVVGLAAGFWPTASRPAAAPVGAGDVRGSRDHSVTA